MARTPRLTWTQRETLLGACAFVFVVGAGAMVIWTTLGFLFGF